MVSLRHNIGISLQPKLRRLQDLQTEIYRQLQLLIPDQIAHYDSFQSHVHGSPLLRMDILERHPYTQFVRLTYQFSKEDTLEIAPDAHIRVYNDARLAEATAFDPVQGFNRQSHRKARPAERPVNTANGSVNGSRTQTHVLAPVSWFSPMHTIQHSWRKNQALDKWLGYLLHQGHSLTSMRPADDRISGAQAKPVKQTVHSG